LEWTGVMELRRPMRTFKVKCPRTLGNPGQLRDCGGWVVPVDMESGALRIRSDSGVGVLQYFSTLCDTFSISGQSRSRSLVRPIIITEGRVTREVEVQRVRHVYIRHTQLDRTQFCIELDDWQIVGNRPSRIYRWKVHHGGSPARRAFIRDKRWNRLSAGNELGSLTGSQKNSPPKAFRTVSRNPSCTKSNP